MHPVVVYADFETINVPIHTCSPSPSSSYTHKKTLHVCSGFSYTVTSPYFPKKVKTYRGEDAGEKFLRNILEEEKIILNKLEKLEIKNHKLTAEEKKQWEEEKTCHICKEKFLKDSTDPKISPKISIELKNLLLANKLDCTKIPSLKKVKSQKRIMSLQLHPDKLINDSEQEKHIKEEELKIFNVANEKLKTYLINHQLLVGEEQDDDFEDEDELTEEEIESIKKKGSKVIDHDHWTGKYRGAAHSGCNLGLRKTKKVPVLFHNLQGYDGHILFQNISKVPECKDPKVIAKSMEKFIGFTIGKLHFIDTLQHLSSSLDKLSSNLAAKTEIAGCKYCPRRGPPKAILRHQRIAHKGDYINEFHHTTKNETLPELFPNLYENFKKKWKKKLEPVEEKAFELLTRKGVYPYAYMDSFERFKETRLPSKEAFFNDLTKKDISEEDFEFAEEIWKTFKLKNLGELHDLYMETDTLLLADVFEKYRRNIHRNYGLDPVHFYTAPSLSWSAGLKYSGAKLEIPHDISMHIFIDNGLRGGISMVANQYAKANNLEMKEQYDAEVKTSYIFFTDANNLYGWAMSQPLPTGGFKWVEKLKSPINAITYGNSKENSKENKSMCEWEQDILNLKDDDETGYIFQVDLEYPKELHSTSLHDNFPLAPETFKIDKDKLSPYQQELGDQVEVKYGSEKLCLTLYDKRKYICHYRNLKFYLRHGMKLKKIHRILQFNQSDWAKSYIDLNTKIRQEADNKFDEDQAKLMNNSFFGKTCEDVRKHKDVHIVRDEAKLKKIVARPTYDQHAIYDENMAAIQMKKNVVNLNKPRYVGQVVLDVSKLLMYQFHYEYIMPKYPNSQLMFTDTDSLCYWIHIDEKSDQSIYKDIQGNSEWFDFSNYSTEHENFDNDVNNLVPGKFKDEMGGNLIQEFVGLRAKMYSILNYDGANKKTAKGVITEVKKRQISHEDFKRSLFDEKVYTHCGTKILQDKHQLYTADVNKVTLNPFNDKKWIKREGNNFTSLSHGNICIN